MTENTAWIQLASVGIPAIFSISAAFLAAKSAKRAKIAENEAERLRALEERVAGHKYKLYQPMIQILGDILTPSRSDRAIAQSEDAIADFQSFVAIWGSDEAVTAFFRYRMASNKNPPPQIMIRLVADFIVAARKDLAWPGTKVSGLETVGMRINDLEQQPEMVEAFTLDFDALAKKYNWEPPWRNMNLSWGL